jgi:chromosome segregation ATPase
MDRALAALAAERDRIQEAKTHADTRIGELVAERDDARKDSAAVAQRLADVSIEAEKRLATIQSECDALIAAKQKNQAELLEAREAHKAQSAVFAREFKSVIGQRDQALVDLTATRTSSEEREAEIAKERAALQKLEQDLHLQHEREMNRLRRDRDSVVQQRDALRARFERVVEEQRELLSDLHADLPASETPLRPARTREGRQEPNVIDISEPASSRDEAPVGGLNIPQARPIPVPPPNVRMR